MGTAIIVCKQIIYFGFERWTYLQGLCLYHSPLNGLETDMLDGIRYMTTFKFQMKVTTMGLVT